MKAEDQGRWKSEDVHDDEPRKETPMPTPVPLAASALGVLAGVFREPFQSENVDVVRLAVADEAETLALFLVPLVLLVISPPHPIRLLLLLAL